MGGRIRVALVALVFSALSFASAAHSASGTGGLPAPRPPTNEDFGRLVFVNSLRSEPHDVTGFGHYKASHALAWSQPLADASSVWTQSCVFSATHYCDMSLYDPIISKYYAYGSSAVGANHAGFWPLEPPQASIIGFESSPPHFANMLWAGHAEFGAEPSYNPATDDGFDVEMFGRFASTDVGVPPIPAAAVMPRVPNTYGNDQARQLLMNYFDPTLAPPKSVVAVYGDATISLPLVVGRAGFGTYGLTTFDPPGNGCVPLHFEATPASGAPYRWPTDSDILVGVGTAGSSCAERAPVTVSPPPAEALSKVAVSLTANHNVSISATLQTFNPTAQDVLATVTWPNNGKFGRGVSLMNACFYAPCTKYRDSEQGFTVSHTRKGGWTFVIKVNGGSLPPYAAGPMTLTITNGGVTRTATVNGVLSNGRLVGR